VEDPAQLRAGLEAELDQVVAVDREVAKPVRARAFLVHDLAEAQERVDLVERRRLSGGAPLAEQVGAEFARDALVRLRYPNALRGRVVRIVRHHMFQVGKGDPVRARRFLAKYGEELAFDLIDHKEADFLGKPGPGGGRLYEDIAKLEHFRKTLERERKHPHRLADLAVDGNDLIALGFPPGPELGHVLRDLLHDVVEEPRLNTKSVLLGRAREKLRR